jgi:predicted CXXCH cytochrome family protein
MGDGGVINMKQTKKKHLLVVLGASLLGLGGFASAGVVGSKHDFSSANATAGVNKVTGTAASGTGTDETCVFCHTPHKAASNTVPLWNKKINTDGTGLNAYSSTTMDGAVSFTGSTSMACLSCHDGTQAMDNIVNAPGSGLYDSTGGGTDGLGYTWLSPGGTVDTITGKFLTTALANLSTNLGDDHPVAIPYGGGGADPSVATTDPDFKLLSKQTIGTNTKWWADADGDTKMESNEIRAYTVGGVAQVECASCHDPHQGNTDPALGATTFLRLANTSSAVCTACHSK